MQVAFRDSKGDIFYHTDLTRKTWVAIRQLAAGVSYEFKVRLRCCYYVTQACTHRAYFVFVHSEERKYRVQKFRCHCCSLQGLESVNYTHARLALTWRYEEFHRKTG